MIILPDSESRALKKLLEGSSPVLVQLQLQLQSILETEIEKTGFGIFIKFILGPGALALSPKSDFKISDVNGIADNVPNGIGYILYVKEGLIELLEGFSYDDPWPKQFENLLLTYSREPRQLEFLSTKT